MKVFFFHFKSVAPPAFSKPPPVLITGWKEFNRICYIQNKPGISVSSFSCEVNNLRIVFINKVGSFLPFFFFEVYFILGLA